MVLKKILPLVFLLPLFAAAQVPLDSLVRAGDTLVLAPVPGTISIVGHQQFIFIAAKRAVPKPVVPVIVPADSLFAGLAPASASNRDNNQGITVGLQFSTTGATVIGARFYAGAAGQHRVYLGKESKTVTAVAGWNRVLFDNPVVLAAGTHTIAVYNAAGYYALTARGLATPLRSGTITSITGVYNYSDALPTASWNSSNYFITPITGK